MLKIKKLETLAGILLVVSTTAGLAGCGSSSDGPMLSDDEKIKKTHEGRAAYDKATGAGQPSVPANAGK